MNEDRNEFKSNKVIPDSDIIRTWFTDRQSAPILSINENADSTKPQSVTLDGTLDVKADDVLIFHDCESVDIAVACSVSTSNNNTVIDLDGCSGDSMTNDGGRKLSVSAINGEVTKLQSALYFIAKEGDDKDNPPALYRRAISKNGDESGNILAQELVRGVENMQILYGIDTDSDGVANQYVTANNSELDNWNSVVSIKVSLLMSTLDNIPADTASKTYNVNGTDIDPADDNRLRKVYTTTILLRNRTT